MLRLRILDAMLWLLEPWRAVAAVLAVLALAASLDGCCTTYYRRDGQRYYRMDSCPWGDEVVCDSATRLPDPATWTEGCR